MLLNVQQLSATKWYTIGPHKILAPRAACHFAARIVGGLEGKVEHGVYLPVREIVLRPYYSSVSVNMELNMGVICQAVS